MEKLNELASSWLGEKDLSGLLDWYDRSIRADVRYVVFVVRRSYVLSHIMEHIASDSYQNRDKMMEDTANKIFLTDSSFLSCCEALFEYYTEKNRFPNILLCDDILIHGRNLNRVIESVEERLIQIAQESQARIDSDEIRNALADAIRIHVYCYADKAKLILKTRYWAHTNYMVRYEPYKWRELSSHISTLIVESGVANATYINSELIDREEKERIISSGFVKRKFQNVAGYTKIKLLGNQQKEIYAIYTLRILDNKVNEYSRVIPFVYMPSLDKVDTEKLYHYIVSRCEEKGYSPIFPKVLERLYAINGKRAFNEWISIILSNAVLQDFNREYGINIDKNFRIRDREQELDKLARNYRFGHKDGWDKTIHRELLEDCIAEKPIFTSLRELDDVLIHCCKNCPIAQLGNSRFDFLEIREGVESYFYRQGYDEEIDAMTYNGSPSRQRGVVRGMVKDCCEVFRLLLGDLSISNAEYVVSLILFMMDAGVLALSSHPANDAVVLGYAQFAKAGEQSLLLRPLHEIEYISFLLMAYNWCKRYALDFYKHLDEFANSEFCHISKRKMEELIQFLRAMSDIGQTIEDWKGDFFEKVSYRSDKRTELLQEQYEFEQRRSRYAQDYKDFINHN